MGTRKCRVRRAHNHGPRLARALFVGALLGVLAKITAPLTLHNFGWHCFHLRGWFFLPVLGLLAILTLLERHCRHSLWSFLTGGGIVVSFVVSLDLFPIAGYVSATTPAEMWTNALNAFLFGGVIGGVLNLALNYLKDFLWGEVVTQDGTMCPTCAYHVLHLPGPRCPECGEAFELADLNPNPLDRRREWRRFAIGFLCVGLVCTLGFLMLPSITFHLAASGWSDHLPTREYLTLRPKHSRDLLLRYLRSESSEERATAAFNLWFVLDPEFGGIGVDPESILAIRSAAINDRVTLVRQLAIQTLGNVNHDSLHEVLEQLLLDSDATVRWSALASAAEGGMVVDPRGTLFLIRALTDPDATVRDYAYQRLISNTGQSFPYDPSAPLESRLEAQACWQAWWVAQPENMP